MITVPPFVENYLNTNGYLNVPFTKVIAAENYPSGYGHLNTYFYRCLAGVVTAKPPSFFSEVMSALDIPGATEMDQMVEFLDRGYRMIDCFDPAFTRYTTADILSDLMILNAGKIVFLTQNNKNTILDLASNPGIAQKIVPDFTRGEVWHTFPARSSSNINKFNNSMRFVVRYGLF